MDIIREELMLKVLHPDHIKLWLDNGMDIEDI
jgi:hypothetical protein